MKNLKRILIFILLTSFLACEPPVTFSEPQPINKNNLAEFPNRIQGLYLSTKDSSTLSIEKNLIQRIYDYQYKIHPNQLDSTSRIDGDKIINLKDNQQIPIKRVGDSLLANIHYNDTLFTLTKDNVLRKYKGYYFLNKRFEKKGWEVKKIGFSKGQMTISSISTKFDIENLKEITENIEDTIAPYNITTTKRQFKKFVKNDGFRDKEIFIKLRKNAL